MGGHILRCLTTSYLPEWRSIDIMKSSNWWNDKKLLKSRKIGFQNCVRNNDFPPAKDRVNPVYCGPVSSRKTIDYKICCKFFGFRKSNLSCIFIKYLAPEFHWRMLLVSLTLISFIGWCQDLINPVKIEVHHENFPKYRAFFQLPEAECEKKIHSGTMKSSSANSKSISET